MIPNFSSFGITLAIVYINSIEWWRSVLILRVAWQGRGAGCGPGLPEI
jgi:ABC-type polysaccharide transport system permease subunit